MDEKIILEIQCGGVAIGTTLLVIENGRLTEYFKGDNALLDSKA